MLNSLDKGHLNSVCTYYVCDKSENARVCAKWQWNALDTCYWIALLLWISITISQWKKLQYCSIGSDNGLASTKRRAIINYSWIYSIHIRQVPPHLGGHLACMNAIDSMSIIKKRPLATVGLTEIGLPDFCAKHRIYYDFPSNLFWTVTMHYVAFQIKN